MSNKPRARRRSGRVASPLPQQWLAALTTSIEDGTDLPDHLSADDLLAVASAYAALADADGRVVLDDGTVFQLHMPS